MIAKAYEMKLKTLRSLHISIYTKKHETWVAISKTYVKQSNFLIKSETEFNRQMN